MGENIAGIGVATGAGDEALDLRRGGEVMLDLRRVSCLFCFGFRAFSSIGVVMIKLKEHVRLLLLGIAVDVRVETVLDALQVGVELVALVF
jgi:hypothetical protein